MIGGLRARCALTALAIALATAPAVAQLDLSRASVERLGNGLTLIMLEEHDVPVVSTQVIYKSGARDEVTGKTGLAHFLEHLAFRSSRAFPAGAANEAIYDRGGEWHGYTWIDQTSYYSTMPKDGLDLLLRIEADRMARVVIDPASIAAEKGAVIAEMHGFENDPDSLLLDALLATAVTAHPYRNNTIGLESDVAALEAGDAREFYERHYAPGNAVVAIAGDFDPVAARSLAMQTLGKLRARALPRRTRAIEPVQKGERRLALSGPVTNPRFAMAFPAPAASSPDFPAFLLLQQLLAGGSGVNFRQNDWGSAAAPGTLLAGATPEIASWFIPTADPYVFVIKGSASIAGDEPRVEAEVERRIARVATLTDSDLDKARQAVRSQLADDLQSTEDAAHQLAYFEGLGALDALIALPRTLDAVTLVDVRRLAATYLTTDQRSIAWMVPGAVTRTTRPGKGTPAPAAPRGGQSSSLSPAPDAVLARLSGGLPIIVKPSRLNPSITVELVTSTAVGEDAAPAELGGLGAIIRSGQKNELPALLISARNALKRGRSAVPAPSRDPDTRLQQLIEARIVTTASPPEPVALIIAGDVDPDAAIAAARATYDTVEVGTRAAPVTATQSADIREAIDLPLAQGAIGYVARTLPQSTRAGLAARLLLYILVHDYSGRLGRSAITDKGLVYHLYAAIRSDGTNSWATLWTGVDPKHADAFEAELRRQIAGLVTAPPSIAEIEAAKRNMLGRDLSAAQTNVEIAAKLAREVVDTDGLRTHTQLERELAAVTSVDVAAAARGFAQGNVFRVDVAQPLSSNK